MTTHQPTTKAEKREDERKKQKRKEQFGATLGTQVNRSRANREYKGSKKNRKNI